MKKYLIEDVAVALQEYQTKTVSISICIKAGSMYEIVNGTAHIMEHLIIAHIKSTKEYSLASIHGITMNAMTGKKFLTIKFLIAKEYLNELYPLIASLFNFKCSDTAVENEKKVINNEIKGHSNKIPHKFIDELYKNSFENAFGKPVLGTLESIREIDSSIINEYFFRRFNRSNIGIGICGHFDERDVVDKLESILLTTGKANIKDSSIFNYCSKHISVDSPDNRYHLCLGIPIPALISPEDKYTSIMNQLLFKNLDSIVFSHLRQEKGLIYSLQSIADTYSEAGLSHLFVYFVCDNNRKDYINDYINNLLSKKAKEFSYMQFVIAQNRAKMEMYQMIDAHYKYSSYIAKKLLNMQEDIEFKNEVNYENCSAEQLSSYLDSVIDPNKFNSLCTNY